MRTDPWANAGFLVLCNTYLDLAEILPPALQATLSADPFAQYSDVQLLQPAEPAPQEMRLSAIAKPGLAPGLPLAPGGQQMRGAPLPMIFGEAAGK